MVRAQAEPISPQSRRSAQWAWSAEDSSTVYYLSQPRDLHTLTLHRLDPAIGEVTPCSARPGPPAWSPTSG